MPSQFRSIFFEFSRTYQTISGTKTLHSPVIKTHLSRDPFFATKLVKFYALNGDLSSARKVFDEIPQRSTFLWNSIIRAYAQAHQFNDAFSLFSEMLGSSARPDNFTYACLVRGCSDDFNSEGLKCVHGGAVVSGFGLDPICGSALVTAYSKFGRAYEARKVFNSIPESDLVLLNAMISGYGCCGFRDKGICLFNFIRNSGRKPDCYTMVGLVTSLMDYSSSKIGQSVHGFCLKTNLDSHARVGSALVSMYSRCEYIDSANSVFTCISQPDLVAWSSLITGYSKCGNYTEVLFSFRKLNMRRLEKPDCVLLACILGSCAKSFSLMHGKEVHGHVIRHGLEMGVMVRSALIDLYSKCGFLDLAIRVFTQMRKKNVVSFNAMILGLGLHGFASLAFEKFTEMLELEMKPDESTFSALLCTCCHSGLVKEGREIFRRMEHEFSVEAQSEHCVYMVKLLGMAGQLKEAFEFIMCLREPLDPGIWGALLSCCEIHQESHLAEIIAQKLLTSKPGKSAYKVLLSNMYARHGRWDEVKRLRDSISTSGGQKVAGISRI